MGRDACDVAVVGAGPAGALASLLLARRGLDVVLLERARFPRAKVCGGCVSAGALEILSAEGLGTLPAEVGALAFDRMRLAGWGRSAELALDGGRAVSRAVFDAALVARAVEAGVTFRDGAHARLLPGADGARRIHVRTHAGEVEEELEARVVVGADGLAGGFVRSNGDATSAAVTPGSRVGLGVLLHGTSGGYEAGVVHMAVDDLGYVGLVRVEHGALNVAAALDADTLREMPPASAVRTILERAGLPVPDGLTEAAWRGTPALTRRPRRLAAERLFRLGDASGYVEPFTGEGMCWALAGARSLAPVAEQAVARWDTRLAARWEASHASTFRRAQRLCRAAAWTLRRPWLSRPVLDALRIFPALAAPFVRAASGPPIPLPTPTA